MKKIMIVLMLLFSIGGSVAAYNRYRPECRRAQDWLKLSKVVAVATLHAAELPKSFEELSDISSLTYRKAFFGDLSPEDKYRVLIEQKRYILAHQLTDEQKGIVTELFEYISVKRLGARSSIVSGVPREPFFPQTLSDKIRKKFTPEETRTYFLTIGTPVLPEPQGALQKIGLVSSTSLPCECSTDSDWCPDYHCYLWGINCSESSWGCGLFWSSACDGECLRQ